MKCDKRQQANVIKQVYRCAYKRPMEISKNLTAKFNCACKIKVIEVTIGKIK